MGYGKGDLTRPWRSRVHGRRSAPADRDAWHALPCLHSNLRGAAELLIACLQKEMRPVPSYGNAEETWARALRLAGSGGRGEEFSRKAHQIDAAERVGEKALGDLDADEADALQKRCQKLEAAATIGTQVVVILIVPALPRPGSGRERKAMMRRGRPRP